MKCVECKSNSSTFDERMGEHICNDCGLVIVTEMFEETVHILNTNSDLIRSADRGKLGSIIRGKGASRFNRGNNGWVIPSHIRQALLHCNMVLSNFSPSPSLKERVEKIYMECYNKNLFGRVSYEDRASAVVFYALKERGTPLPLKEITAEFEVNPKHTRKIIRRINSLYRNQINYGETNPAYMLEYTLLKITEDRSYLKQCLEVLVKFENIISNSDYTKSRSYYASICWITSNLFERREYSRKLIAKNTEIDEKCIYHQTKALMKLIGFSTVKEIKGKEINKIGETNV